MTLLVKLGSQYEDDVDIDAAQWHWHCRLFEQQHYSWHCSIHNRFERALNDVNEVRTGWMLKVAFRCAYYQKFLHLVLVWWIERCFFFFFSSSFSSFFFFAVGEGSEVHENVKCGLLDQTFNNECDLSMLPWWNEGCSKPSLILETTHLLPDNIGTFPVLTCWSWTEVNFSISKYNIHISVNVSVILWT